jgi:hypothetical protein
LRSNGPGWQRIRNTWLKNRRHNRVIAKIVPRAKVEAAPHVRADVPLAVVGIVADVPAVEIAVTVDRVPAAVGIVAASDVLTDRPRSNSTS